MQIVHSDFHDQLVRGLTHRMNNILTLFHGYSSLLLDNPKLDPGTADGLAKIRQGATQAAELMDRVQTLIRPSSTVWRSLDLGQLAVSLQSTFELFRKPNTEIEIKIADDLPKIQGDTARLKIAVTELVRNACEATAETGGKVLIEIRAEAVPGQRTEQILIRVSDNGSGIPADQVQRVFQPFHSARRKANAAGLGLALVSSIVSLHKGVVRLESQPGRTLAEIRLPLSE